MKKINNKNITVDLSGSSRLRYWEVVLYVDENRLISLLVANVERISHYAYIYHDKDVYLDDEEEKDDDGNVVYSHKEGDLKRPHFHLLVDFYNGHTFTAVKKIFTTENDKPRVKRILSRSGAFEYMVHKNDPDKFQYAYDLIESDDIKYYEKFCKEGYSTDKDNISEQIIADILNNVPPRLLVRRYKRDFILNMQRYYDCAEKIKLWDIEHPRLRRIDEAEFKAVQEEISFE